MVSLRSLNHEIHVKSMGLEPERLSIIPDWPRAIEESLSQKREANAFVDVITAEDVGKFPDKNVADSLQRVPGVIIDRDGGEGSRVSIRGLSSDLTLTELNGNFIASADSGDPSRSFNYLLLPSTLIGSVEVYKSSEARLDEGGVGGVIINRTRRPFDLKPWSGNISVEGTYADVTRKVEPNVSGLVSWHNEEKTFGLLLGATYQDSYFVREDNSVQVPDYIRFDAAVFSDVSETLRLQLNVENLFDTDYFPDAHSNTNISTGEPLNARLTLQTRF